MSNDRDKNWESILAVAQQRVEKGEDVEDVFREILDILRHELLKAKMEGLPADVAENYKNKVSEIYDGAEVLLKGMLDAWRKSQTKH